MRSHFPSVVSLFHKELERRAAMCEKIPHIAWTPKMAVSGALPHIMGHFGEEAGKRDGGIASRQFLALDSRLCDSFLPLVLKCRRTVPDGWRRKAGGSVELAGSFSGGFRR